MKVIRLIGFGCCLASLVLGCDRGEGPAGSSPVVVTNVVTMKREVTVTNVIEKTVTVTNVVIEKREPERVLSARKTAPYVVSAKALTATQLLKVLSGSGARVVSCGPGAVALVEASDKTVRALRGVVGIAPLLPEDKIAVDVGESVRIVPLSSIDAAAVAKAVRELGGEIVQVVTVGSPAVRAKMSYSLVYKLAKRGDVRRIERDEK